MKICLEMKIKIELFILITNVYHLTFEKWVISKLPYK